MGPLELLAYVLLANGLSLILLSFGFPSAQRGKGTLSQSLALGGAWVFLAGVTAGFVNVAVMVIGGL